MTMSTPPPVTSWRVTGQQEWTEIDPGGTPVRGVKVFYQTGAGVESSVFIPQSQYTADQVRAAIAARAAVNDQVAGLASES